MFKNQEKNNQDLKPYLINYRNLPVAGLPASPS